MRIFCYFICYNFHIWLQGLGETTPSTILGVVDGMTPSIQVPVLTAGTFYWHVTASNGNSSTSSPIHSFTVCFVVPPEIPQLTSPMDGQQNVPSSVLLQWQHTNFGQGCINPLNKYQVFLSTHSNPDDIAYEGPLKSFNATGLQVTISRLIMS